MQIGSDRVVVRLEVRNNKSDTRKPLNTRSRSRNLSQAMSPSLSHNCDSKGYVAAATELLIKTVHGSAINQTNQVVVLPLPLLLCPKATTITAHTKIVKQFGKTTLFCSTSTMEAAPSAVAKSSGWPCVYVYKLLAMRSSLQTKDLLPDLGPGTMVVSF